MKAPYTSQIKIELTNILEPLKDKLHPLGLANVNDLIRVGEYAVALEFLSDYLHEDKIGISQNSYKDIKNLAQKLKLKPIYWESLIDLV